MARGRQLESWKLAKVIGYIDVNSCGQRGVAAIDIERTIMSEKGESIRPARRKTGFLWAELKSLIDTLLDLHTQISSRLLASRVSSSELSSAAENGADNISLRKDNADIGVRDATTPGDVPESTQTMPEEPGEKEEEHVEAGVAIESVGDAPLHPNELSEYLRDHDVGREFEHHLSGKLQVDTVDHINRALVLAKQGNREGAYAHAELAENAMRLAGEYMPEVEYEAFRRDMERRLESATGRR
jgi:hypothetical protein